MRDRWFSRRALRRLPMLLSGLVLFGVGVALMADAGQGLGPWDVFHQGIARRTGLELGTVTILIGIPILAMWIPLRERPGIGTVCNIAVIGLATNIALPLLPTPAELPLQSVEMALGVITIGFASGMYLATDLGPGPRDGLMTGLHHRFGISIRRARTTLELTVLGAGFLLGGTVGLGTVVFALGIGPVVQWSLGIFDRTGAVARRRTRALGPPQIPILDALEGPAE